MAKIYGFKASDGEPKGVAVNDDGELIVNADSSALPTGAATSAKQDTGNTSLSSIDGKLATLASMSADLATIQADIAPMKADLAAILAILES
jgi:hypothetical protein